MKTHKMLKVPADLHASIKLEAASRGVTIMAYLDLIHGEANGVRVVTKPKAVSPSVITVGGVPTRVRG